MSKSKSRDGDNVVPIRQPRPTTKRRRTLASFDVDKCYTLLEHMSRLEKPYEIPCASLTKADHFRVELQGFRAAYRDAGHADAEKLYKVRIGVKGDPRNRAAPAFLVFTPVNHDIDELLSAAGVEVKPATNEEFARMLDEGEAAPVDERFNIMNILRGAGPTPEVEPDVRAEPSGKPDKIIDPNDLP